MEEKFEVGKRFPIQVAGLFMLRLMGRQGAVIFNFPAPTRREQDQFQDTNLKMGIFQHDFGIAFLLMKFKDGNWMDTPIHFLQNDKESLSAFYAACEGLDNDKTPTIPMGLFMIDANTQILKQMRLIGPSPSFWLKLKDVYQNQEKRKLPYNESMIRFIYGQMTSEEMAKKRRNK